MNSQSTSSPPHKYFTPNLDRQKKDLLHLLLLGPIVRVGSLNRNSELVTPV